MPMKEDLISLFVTEETEAQRGKVSHPKITQLIRGAAGMPSQVHDLAKLQKVFNKGTFPPPPPPHQGYL